MMQRNRIFLKFLNVQRPLTVRSASSAADYQQGQQAMSIFTGAVIHGGQFNIFIISSLNQSPTLATPETEIKSTKRY